MGVLLFFTLQPTYLPKEFEYKILIVIFLSTYVIPILFLFILKKRNSIESYHLKTTEERKFPILFFLTITFLLGMRLLELNAIDLLAYSFIAGSLSLLITYILLFTKFKTSLHTLSIGSLIGFVIIISIHYKIKLLLLITTGVLLFGIIGTARLKLKAHTVNEVLLGFAIGVITQILIYYSLPFILS